MIIRMRYSFIGDVQGVGFRFRAYHAANTLGLTGWVRNEYNGSVTMEVQGERYGINTILEMIGSGYYIHIDDIDSKELPIDPDESFFEIRECSIKYGKNAR